MVFVRCAWVGWGTALELLKFRSMQVDAEIEGGPQWAALVGITDWAQVNYPYGASLEDARRKLPYDLYYVCNASPLLDLRTWLRTARVVLFRPGSR